MVTETTLKEKRTGKKSNLTIITTSMVKVVIQTLRSTTFEHFFNVHKNQSVLKHHVL